MKTNYLLILTALLPLATRANTPEPHSALSFQQTTNTRIVVEENHLRFFTGGSERMTIDTDGNVGIGTTDPYGRLHVIGSHHWLYTSRGTSNGWSQDGLTVEANPDAGYSTLKVHSNHSAVSDRGLLNITRQSDQLFYVRADGNVGIGTNSPSSKLHVQNGSVGVRSQFAIATVEAVDAHLDVVSSSDGTWGSSINLIEGNGASNTDLWSMTRLTTNGNGNSSFRINYGTQNTGVNDTKLTILTDGKVGIGITNPQSELQVSGGNVDGVIWPVTVSNTRNTSAVTGYGSGLKLRLSGNHENKWSGIAAIQGGSWANVSDLAFYANESEKVRIRYNGNVGIGTTSPSQKLDVAGNINADKYYAAGIQAWPDYVFEDTYELNELDQVEKYIEENHHLPEIPSASEVAVNGIDIVDMQAKLLQKIEELTLYVIDLKKENESQQKEIEKLKCQ